MAQSVVKTSDTLNGYKKDNTVEIVIDTTDDVDSLPMDCAPGSRAYTADMSATYVFSPSGSWVEAVGTSIR